MKLVNLAIYTDNPIPKNLGKLSSHQTLLDIHYQNEEIFWSVNIWSRFSEMAVSVDGQLGRDMGNLRPMYRRFVFNNLQEYLRWNI